MTTYRHHVYDCAIFARKKTTVFKNSSTLFFTWQKSSAAHWIAIASAFGAHKWQKVTCPMNVNRCSRATRVFKNNWQDGLHSFLCILNRFNVPVVLVRYMRNYAQFEWQFMYCSDCKQSKVPVNDCKMCKTVCFSCFAQAMWHSRPKKIEHIISFNLIPLCFMWTLMANVWLMVFDRLVNRRSGRIWSLNSKSAQCMSLVSFSRWNSTQQVIPTE